MNNYFYSNRIQVRKLPLFDPPLAGEQEKLDSARLKLHHNIVKWRELQFTKFPLLRDKLDSVDSSMPEQLPLHLPSSFSQPFRSALGLDAAASIEYRLREAQAHDALTKLRAKIQEQNYNLAFKVHNVHGQARNTRAQAILSKLEAEKKNIADKYRIAHISLLNLGMSKTNSFLKPLLDNQLWAKNASLPSKLGDSRTEDPWFWHVVRPDGMSKAEEDEWNVESILNESFTNFLHS